LFFHSEQKRAEILSDLIQTMLEAMLVIDQMQSAMVFLAETHYVLVRNQAVAPAVNDLYRVSRTANLMWRIIIHIHGRRQQKKAFNRDGGAGGL